MPSPRLILGASLAILLVISAASIGLDLKSQADKAWVDHTGVVLKQMADMRLLIRRAESAARGFALIGDPNLATEFNRSNNAIAPAFSELLAAIGDNPAQIRLLEETRTLVERRIAISADLIRLKGAGDTAGIAELIAQAQGRAAMEAIDANFEKAQTEERQRLAQRSAQSKSSGRILLAVDVVGISLILILAIIMMHQTRRSNRVLADSLSATRATNKSLEAAVAERTEHLVAAHEQLRHSTTVLQSTFHSMAEAVLVIDTKGEILLSNPAAEKMLRYRPGMNMIRLRALITALHIDGVTPMTAEEMPAARSLRGEEFDDIEFDRPPQERPRSGPSRGQRPPAARCRGRDQRCGAGLSRHLGLARNRAQAAAVAEAGRDRQAHRRRRA